MTQSRVQAAKDFLAQAGFKNAVFTGDQTKPTEPMVVPNQLFADSPYSPTAHTAPGVQPPPRPRPPKTPWEQLTDVDNKGKNPELKDVTAKVWQEEAKRLSDMRLTADYADDGNARRREMEQAAEAEQKIKSTLWPMVKESLGLTDEVQSPDVVNYASTFGARSYGIRALEGRDLYASLLSRVGNDAWRSLVKTWCRHHPEAWEGIEEMYNAFPQQGLANGTQILAFQLKTLQSNFEHLRTEVESDLLKDRVNLGGMVSTVKPAL